MRRQVVHTPKVPPARVPLSQAIQVGDWVFAPGQLGLDVSMGKLAEGGASARINHDVQATASSRA